jgi:tetratricopeptide (TPR) repeat protein
LAAEKLEPENDGILMNLARLYSNKGDDADAVLYANQTLGISTDNYIRSVAYIIIGTASADYKDYVDSIREYTLAIEANPKYQNPYQSRAYIYISQAEGMTDIVKRDNLLGLATLDINNALSIQSSSSFATWLQGYVYWVKGDKQQAASYFTKALGMVDADITLGSVEKDNMRSQIKDSLNSIKS